MDGAQPLDMFETIDADQLATVAGGSQFDFRAILQSVFQSGLQGFAQGALDALQPLIAQLFGGGQQQQQQVAAAPTQDSQPADAADAA